jgi:hypothetical protein
MNTINDAARSRSLVESIMMPESIDALRDWKRAGGGGVLIGGAALSFHVRPRLIQDLEFLFPEVANIRDAISGFTRVSRGLFQHDRTGVEVNIVTPAGIQVPVEVAEEFARSAILSDLVIVASESGLIALKLFRRSRQDEADIVALVKTGRVDLSGFPLAAEKLSAFQELVEVAQYDSHPP